MNFDVNEQAVVDAELNLPLLPGCVAACPGCKHRTWTQSRSEQQKQQWLSRALAAWAACLLPLRSVEGEARWGYRDKVCLNVEWSGDAWQFGMMRWDELIAIPECPVHSDRARQVIALLRDVLPPAERFPLAFYAQAGAQITLIVKTRDLPDVTWLDDGARARLAAIGVDGFWVHCHPCAGRRLYARNGWHLLWGTPKSIDAQGFSYGPAAFQQLIDVLYHQALDAALAFLQPSHSSRVLDLYSGIGISMRRWLDADAEVIGVELSGDAVTRAQENAVGAEMLRGTCVQRIPQLDGWVKQAPQADELLAFVNPPRTGLEPEILAWLATQARPTRIAYLSCSAGTLARDLRVLCDNGYRVQTLQPFDFFPQTPHVETLALLSL